MSDPGDVVWSGGRAWQRGKYGSSHGVKAWWINAAVRTETLKALRKADDFRWLVKEGKRVVHADDYPPQVAHEAYTFQIANLTELLAQAEKDRDMYAADWDRVLASWDKARAKLADALARSGEVAADANDAYRAGGLAERAAIVAWLREKCGHQLANAVERGDHLGATMSGLVGVELMCDWCGNLTPLAKMVDVGRCDNCAAEIAEADDE